MPNRSEIRLESAKELKWLVGKRIWGLTTFLLLLLFLMAFYSYFKLEDTYQGIKKISEAYIPLRKNIRDIYAYPVQQFLETAKLLKELKKETKKTEKDREKVLNEFLRYSLLTTEALKQAKTLSLELGLFKNTEIMLLLSDYTQEYTNFQTQGKILLENILDQDPDEISELFEEEQKNVRGMSTMAVELRSRIESETDQSINLIKETEKETIRINIFIGVIAMVMGILWSILITRHILKRLVWNIHQREMAEKKLLESAKELERSNRDLEQFAYVTSHDLQSPLAAILGYTGIMKIKSFSSMKDEEKKYVDRIHEVALTMSHFIRSLLDYSRVMNENKPLEDVNLEKVVQEVVSSFEIKLRDVNGKIECSDLAIIKARYVYMKQLFQNLISNALKFSKKEVAPVIVIKSREIPKGWLEITVKDNGVGFDEKNSDKMFEIFNRLHPQSEYEGSGIGLATCQKIVHKLGGTIKANGALGQGAVFTITLPFLRESSSGI